MGLFSGGLTFGSFFVYQIVGLIFGWANFRVGLLSGVYGIWSVGNGLFRQVNWYMNNDFLKYYIKTLKLRTLIIDKLVQVT